MEWLDYEEEDGSDHFYSEKVEESEVVALGARVFIGWWIFDLDKEVDDVIGCEVAEEVHEDEEKKVRNEVWERYRAEF